MVNVENLKKRRVLGCFDVIPHKSTKTIEVVYNTDQFKSKLKKLKEYNGDFFELCTENNWQWEGYESSFKHGPVKSNIDFISIITVTKNESKRRFSIISLRGHLFIGSISLYEKILEDISTPLWRIEEIYLKKFQ